MTSFSRPAPLERSRCFAVRSLLRVTITLARLSVKLLPESHPSRVFAESYLRASRLERIAAATLPRIDDERRPALNDALFVCGAAAVAYQFAPLLPF